jgi:hypothetical protein
MNARDDGGPAFPRSDHVSNSNAGMTLRQYAAIKLCVPDSGLDWLDDMIRQAQRDRFAGQAIAGLAARRSLLRDDSANFAYKLADAVIAERKGGAA